MQVINFHCDVIKRQTVNYVDIYLGKHDRTVSEDNQKLYSSSENFVHPDWNPTTQVGDIALIKLKSSVKLSRKYHLLYKVNNFISSFA